MYSLALLEALNLAMRQTIQKKGPEVPLLEST